MALIFTTLGSDTFNRANENPLDPTNWQNVTSDGLQIVSDEAVATATGVNNISVWKAALPDDQFAQATVFIDAGEFNIGFINARFTSLSNSGYAVNLINFSPSSQFIELDSSSSILFSNSGPFNAGDEFIVAAVGTTIYLFQNGTQLAAVTDSTASSGKAALGAQPDSSVSQVGFTDFVTGSVSDPFTISGNAGVASALVSYSGTSSGSVTADGSGNYTIPNISNGSYTITPSLSGFSFSPTSQNVTVSGGDVTGINFTASSGPVAVGWSPQDCRQAVPGYGPGPNFGVVQPDGSVHYVGQVSSNEHIPTPDAREAGAPVDSRVSEPTNSRVDPSTVEPN
jgi:carboxypeptidase family protein